MTETQTRPEPTPIFDAMVEEFGNPLNRRRRPEQLMIEPGEATVEIVAVPADTPKRRARKPRQTSGS